MSLENLTKSNLSLGTGVSSLTIILLLIGTGSVSGASDSVTVDLQNHILEESHPITKERLNQILDKVDDIEKEMEDNEKQMKLINKEINSLKLIICSNQEFNCIIDLLQ